MPIFKKTSEGSYMPLMEDNWPASASFLALNISADDDYNAEYYYFSSDDKKIDDSEGEHYEATPPKASISQDQYFTKEEIQYLQNLCRLVDLYNKKYQETIKTSPEWKGIIKLDISVSSTAIDKEDKSNVINNIAGIERQSKENDFLYSILFCISEHASPNKLSATEAFRITNKENQLPLLKFIIELIKSEEKLPSSFNYQYYSNAYQNIIEKIITPLKNKEAFISSLKELENELRNNIDNQTLRSIYSYKVLEFFKSNQFKIDSDIQQLIFKHEKPWALLESLKKLRLNNILNNMTSEILCTYHHNPEHLATAFLELHKKALLNTKLCRAVAMYENSTELAKTVLLHQSPNDLADALLMIAQFNISLTPNTQKKLVASTFPDGSALRIICDHEIPNNPFSKSKAQPVTPSTETESESSSFFDVALSYPAATKSLLFALALSAVVFAVAIFIFALPVITTAIAGTTAFVGGLALGIALFSKKNSLESGDANVPPVPSCSM